MIDLNHLMTARGAYEERVHKAELELMKRQHLPQQPGVLNKLLYGLGERLEATGLQLKAQHQPVSN